MVMVMQARQIWGTVVNTCRSLARLGAVTLGPDSEEWQEMKEYLRVKRRTFLGCKGVGARGQWTGLVVVSALVRILQFFEVKSGQGDARAHTHFRNKYNGSPPWEVQ